MCPPFVSLLVSALYRWPCSISIHLSPRSVAAGVRPFPLAMQRLSISRAVAKKPGKMPSRSASALQSFNLHLSPSSDCCVRLCLAILYTCPCNPLHLSPSSRLLYPLLGCMCLHLSPSSGLLWPPVPCNPLLATLCLPALTPFLLAMQHFYSFVSQVCHCSGWPCSICIRLSPRSVAAGSALFRWPFLFICLPGLSLLVSAPFRWRCSISIHVSPRSVTGGARPFPLAVQRFYSCVAQVCHWRCRPFSAYSFFPMSLLVSALFHSPCRISIHVLPM